MISSFLVRTLFPSAVLLLSGFVLLQDRSVTPAYADVAEILDANCVMCHNGPRAPKGLQLADYGLLMKGSARGPVVIPGQAAKSEIGRRIRGLSEPRMPLSGPPWLSEEEMDLIERWIAAGAPGPQPARRGEDGPRERDSAGPATFADVASILFLRCAKCHAPSGLMGPAPEGYVLTSFADVLEARDRARVIPGNVSASELIRRIRGQAVPRMPLDGPPYLADDEIRLLEQWIEQGARDNSGNPSPIPHGASVRLHGALSGPLMLDDLPLTPGSRMERRKAPTPGSFVEVRGTVRPDGSIEVARITTREVPRSLLR